MQQITKPTRLSVKFIGYSLIAIFIVFLIELTSYFAADYVLDYGLGNSSARHLYSPIRGHKLNPNYRRRFDTNNGFTHSIQGFRRDGLIRKKRPEDTLRIFVLGGSTLYGIGSSGRAKYPAHPTLKNDETVTHYLEAALRKRYGSSHPHLKFEVINAGVVAYQTFQHVLYIFETLYEYDPDIILFLDGHNDFYNASTANSITSYSYSSWAMIDALNERQFFFSLHASLRYLATYSYFFCIAENVARKLFEKYEAKKLKLWRIDPDLTASDFTHDTLKKSAKNGFIRNYKIIQALGDYHGFGIHVFLQPEIVFEDPAVLSDHDREIASITKNIYPDKVFKLMSSYRTLFLRLFEENDVPFTAIDTISSVDEREQALYIDYCHLTPRGSWLVAQRMLPTVQRMISDILSKRRGPGAHFLAD